MTKHTDQLRNQNEEKENRAAELAIADAQFRTLFENAPISICITDLQGNLLVFNNAMLEMSGYTQAEIEKFAGLAAWYEDPKQSEEALALFKKQGVLKNYEVRLRRKDGTPCDSLLSLTHTIFHGKPCIQATALDITEQNRTKATLQKSEQRFREIFENTNDAIYIWNLGEDGTITTGTEVNDVACKRMGYSKEEFLQLSPMAINARNIREELPGMLAPLLSQGQMVTEALHRTKDGRIIPVEISSRIVELMGKKKIISVARDISERLRAEQEAAFLASIVQSSTDAILGKTLDGIIVSCNPSAERIFGYTADEIKGQNVSILASPDHPDETAHLIEEIKRNQTILHYDTVRRRKDGSLVDVSLALSPIRDIQGRLTGIASISHDISERKQAEENLKKAMEDQARSNAELERFAYVASHDLQEPLRMVTSYLQLLERRYKDKLDGDALDFINFAVDGSNRMKTLINDLLAYSRVGTRGKEFSRTNCEEILEWALANLQVSIEENRAEISHDPLPVVMADETQLESLFQNLIGNAIKFHSPLPPRIHVGVWPENRNWVFSVSDNGIGIDPQYFERIFIIFQRLHNREEYPGTGIGLAISKRIVERHGGRMWIESKPGQGSTFFFTLPFMENKND